MSTFLLKTIFVCQMVFVQGCPSSVCPGNDGDSSPATIVCKLFRPKWDKSYTVVVIWKQFEAIQEDRSSFKENRFGRNFCLVLFCRRSQGNWIKTDLYSDNLQFSKDQNVMVQKSSQRRSLRWQMKNLNLVNYSLLCKIMNLSADDKVDYAWVNISIHLQ